MTIARLILPALLLLAGCKGHDAAPKVSQAWIRLPAVPGQPAAAYFTLRADGETLVRIETTMAKRTEMHETMAGEHAMMTMAPLDHVDVHGTVTFAPVGKHAMIFGLDPVVTPGTAVPLRFGFASGKTAEAEAKTVAAGDGAPY